MRQSYLTNAAGLKTAGFLMLVEPVLLNQRIDEMSDEDLDFFLARFVAEVRKEDGQEYPGKTIYEMICSLQCYLRIRT